MDSEIVIGSKKYSHLMIDQDSTLLCAMLIVSIEKMFFSSKLSLALFAVYKYGLKNF